MFDVGIWELALIMLLALVIVGPKRLPEVAMKAGEWFNKFRKLQQGLHKIYNEYADYPNAGKHLLGLDSKTQNSNQLEAVKKEFDDIKKELESVSESALSSDSSLDSDEDAANKSKNQKPQSDSK